ncbi:MAG: hypothetical protein M0026_01895 [Nocardiopsaceae bacterium]|nr:hypothetical protein [Nocardiopsaceae bacterium]
MTTTDRNGNRVNDFGVPVRPIDAEPAAAYHGDGEFKGAESQEVILRDALARAGVDLGAHDERIVQWFARLTDWSTFATVVSWIERARRDPEDFVPGGTLPPAAPGLHRVFVDLYAADFGPDDDTTPRRIWSISERAVTEIPREGWTDRMLDTINRGKSRRR